MITLTKPQVPQPTTLTCWKFLLHLDGVDIWYDPDDRLTPYFLANEDEHEALLDAEVLRGSACRDWPGTVFTYLLGHYNLAYP